MSKVMHLPGELVGEDLRLTPLLSSQDENDRFRVFEWTFTADGLPGVARVRVSARRNPRYQIVTLYRCSPCCRAGVTRSKFAGRMERELRAEVERGRHQIPPLLAERIGSGEALWADQCDRCKIFLEDDETGLRTSASQQELEELWHVRDSSGVIPYASEAGLNKVALWLGLGSINPLDQVLLHTSLDLKLSELINNLCAAEDLYCYDGRTQ